MKIISLEGENLASLAAPFHINFATGMLADAGLFAICGNTGAGKSTLLDAICLSLFDAMPRFSSSNRGAAIGHAGSEEKERLKSNDVRHILTRGAANGFAQVTFELDNAKQYQARWSVKRARNSAQGRFQAQEMQLTDCQTNQMLATKKTEVLALIESLIGLNYDQFKRSVLLAQGDFAAFLKAPAKERSELLERITGTQLYSQLSKQAFLKAKEQEQALLMLESKIGEVQLLSQEEQTQLANELADINDQISGVNHQHKVFTWFEQTLSEQQQIGASLTHSKAQLSDAMALIKQQDSINQILDKIEQAQDARVVFAQLKQQQQAYNQQSALVKTLQQECGIQEKNYEETQRQSNQLEQLKLQAQQHYEKRLPDIELAITKTIELAALSEQLGNMQKQLSLLEEQRSSNARKFNQSEQQLKTSTQEFNNLQQYLAEHEHIAPLVTQLSTVEQHIHEYSQTKLRGEQHQQSLTNNKQQTETINETMVSLNTALITHQQQHQQSQQQLNDFAESFKNSDLETLELDLSEQQQQHIMLTNEQQLIVQGLQYQQMISHKNQQHQIIEQELEQLRHSYRQSRQQLDVHLPVRDEAAKALGISKQVMSLSAHRETLIDGEPCALCGSNEHPYSNQHYVGDELISQLSQRCEQLEQQAKQYHDQLTKYDVIGKQKAEQLQQLVQENNELSQMIKQLSIKDISQQRQGEVEHLLAKALNNTEQLKAQIKQVTAWITQAQQLEQQALKQQHTMASIEQDLVNYQQKVNGLASDYTLTVQSIKQCQQQQMARIDALSAIYNYVQWQDILAVDVELLAFKREIATQVEHYKSALETHNSVDKYITQIKQQSIAFQEQNSQNDAQFRPMLAQYQQDEQRVKSQQEMLFSLTEGDIPQEIKYKLEQEVNQLTSAHKNAYDALTLLHNASLVTQSKLTQTQDYLSELTNSISIIDQQWQSWQTNLAMNEQALIELLGYEQDWIIEQRQNQALLLQQSHVAQSVVTQQQKQLTHIDSQLSQRNDEILVLFPSLLPNPLTSNEEQRKMVLATVGAQLNQFNQQQFECRSRLEQHNQGMLRFGELQSKIEKQQENTQLWQNMKELIGSADGAKFRTFAQSLTLEQMLIGANHHLADLAPRYCLQRVPGAELDLQMIDKNMGDEVRSIDSLSGGETFLVSLALALGLGSLTSLQTTIRSLFIDEGFGTLDPDTLEIALSCLDSLQASGRQIGIISHVQGLVERVGTRIQITSIGDGHSNIKLLVR
jgi:exonuclease SbcC